jgi:hypothetical protein
VGRLELWWVGWMLRRRSTAKGEKELASTAGEMAHDRRNCKLAPGTIRMPGCEPLEVPTRLTRRKD